MSLEIHRVKNRMPSGQKQRIVSWLLVIVIAAIIAVPAYYIGKDILGMFESLY